MTNLETKDLRRTRGTLVSLPGRHLLIWLLVTIAIATGGTRLYAGTLSYTFTSFDSPGQVFGTTASGINNSGYIVGHYEDINSVQSFLRDPAGFISPIAFPGAI